MVAVTSLRSKVGTHILFHVSLHLHPSIPLAPHWRKSQSLIWHPYDRNLLPEPLFPYFTENCTNDVLQSFSPITISPILHLTQALSKTLMYTT